MKDGTAVKDELHITADFIKSNYAPLIGFRSIELTCDHDSGDWRGPCSSHLRRRAIQRQTRQIDGRRLL